MSSCKLPPGKALILRTCKADGRSPSASANGFVWPRSGRVECKDWSPTPECGNGLHGLLWGEGDGSLMCWEADALWIVAEVDEAACVDLGGKVKFRAAEVVHCGDRKSATDFVLGHLTRSASVVGATLTAGYRGTATAGYYGTATAGYLGTATAGYYGTATAGDRGTATAGYRGTATAGYYGTATAGYRGTATAGDYGTATAGDRGMATAGDLGMATAGKGGMAAAGYYGTATAGDYGTATAGDYGTATAGDLGTATAGDLGTATAGGYGTATAGNGGTLQFLFWGGDRRRIVTLYVGEDGIEANVAYRLGRDRKPERVEPQGGSDGE